MKEYLFCIILICLFFFQGNTQSKYDYIWLLGYDPNNPASFFGGSELDFHQSPMQVSYFEIPFDFDAIAIISDRWGQLVAYTNGCEIMNREHALMLNGDQINAGEIHDGFCSQGYPSGQGVLFLPFPDDTSKYGLFHLWYNGNAFLTRLLYSELDQNGDGGQGEVLLKNQPVIQDTLTKQLTAVRHGNGRDWWVVVPETYRNGYYFVLWTPAGIGTPVYQQIGPDWTVQNWSGQAAFSPNGEWYARINPYNEMDLFRFDRCAGSLYDPLHLGFPGETIAAAGVAFSPNSRFLYASIQLKIYQYDLWAADIAGSRELVAEYDGFTSPFSTTFFQAMVGPDGKIYLTAPNGVNILHVIHQPDEKGQACEVEQHGITLPAYHGFYVPNFAHYRLLDKPGSPCDTLGIDGGPNVSVEETAGVPSGLKVYPNPASGELYVHLPEAGQGGRFRLYDALGRQALAFAATQGEATYIVSLEGLAAGWYVLVYEEEGGEVRRMMARVVVE
jgi:hypothetical protein